MLMNGISLCMIVRDEEQVLGRCLSSVKDVVTEIVIVDTGSVDSSREIARKHGAVVVSVPWGNDFAQARNVALGIASQPWILVLDADEEWTPAVSMSVPVTVPGFPQSHESTQSPQSPQNSELNSLSSLLDHAAQEGVLGFNVRLLSYVGNGKEYMTDSVCRLFRNHPRIRFEGSLHEEVASSIGRLLLTGISADTLPMQIVHYGYLDDIIAAKDKNKRNMDIIVALLERNPGHPYWLYALGTEYFQQGRYAQALEVYERLRACVPADAGYLSDFMLKLVFSYKEVGSHSQATAIAEEALQAYSDFPDLLELRAILAADVDQYDLALEFLTRALEGGDRSDKYSTCSGTGTYRTEHLIGHVYERMGKLPEAVKAYEQSLRTYPGYLPSEQRLRVIQG